MPLACVECNKTSCTCDNFIIIEDEKNVVKKQLLRKDIVETVTVTTAVCKCGETYLLDKCRTIKCKCGRKAYYWITEKPDTYTMLLRLGRTARDKCTVCAGLGTTCVKNPKYCHCPACDGTRGLQCPTCMGNGFWVERDHGYQTSYIAKCDNCIRGFTRICSLCGGKGAIESGTYDVHEKCSYCKD